MKKQKLKNLQLNKMQISNLRGGANAVGTDTQGCNVTDGCPTIFDYTCRGGCMSQERTCYSEYGPVCGSETFDPGGCEVTIVTIEPSQLRID